MRRHPIFVLLDNATARQLAIGACVALGIVGLFAGVQYINEPSLDPPSEWLTGTTESELRNSIEQLRSENPGTWIAGCAWQHEADSPASVLDVPGSPSNFRAEASSGHDMTFAVSEGTGGSMSLEGVGGPGYFCLTPTDSLD